MQNPAIMNPRITDRIRDRYTQFPLNITDLLTSILEVANFSDEKAWSHIFVLIENHAEESDRNVSPDRSVPSSTIHR